MLSSLQKVEEPDIENIISRNGIRSPTTIPIVVGHPETGKPTTDRTCARGELSDKDMDCAKLRQVGTFSYSCLALFRDYSESLSVVGVLMLSSLQKVEEPDIENIISRNGIRSPTTIPIVVGHPETGRPTTDRGSDKDSGLGQIAPGRHISPFMPGLVQRLF